MAIELGTAYVNVVPSARGIQANLTKELSGVSAAAAVEGNKAGKALGAGIAGAGLSKTIEKEASLSSRAIGKVGIAARGLDQQLAAFGVPFAGSAGRVLSSLQGMESRTKSLGSSLSNIGRGELTAAGIGLVAVGSEAVHLADDLETAHAREVTSIRNAGASYQDYQSQLDGTNKKMEALGFRNADTESSVAALTNATHSVGKSLKDESLAADIARGRHIELQYATTLLMKVETGHVALLGRLGINIKDANGKIISQEEALRRLSATYRGQAAAAAETFAGKMTVLRAKAEDLGATLGVAVVPKIEDLASGALGAVQSLESANAATGGWLGKLALTAAAIPAVVFALGKLSSVTVGVGAALDTGLAGVSGVIGRVRGPAASNGALAGSAAANAAAGVGADRLAASSIAAADGMQAEVASALKLTEADAALAEVQFELANSAIVDEAALARLATAENAASVAAARYAEAQTAASLATGRAAASQELAGAKAIGARGGFAAVGAILPEVVVGLVGAHLAATNISHTFFSAGQASDQLVGSLKRLSDAGVAGPTLTSKFGVNFKNLASDINQIHSDSSGFSRVTLDVGHFLGMTTDAEDHVKSLSNSLKKLYATDPSAALSAFANIKAHLIAAGVSGARVDAIFKDLEKTIPGLSGPIDKTTLAQTRLNDAQRKYTNDLLAHRPNSVLAADYEAVKGAATDFYQAQNLVTAATEAGSGSAAKAGFAYLGLADSVKTAADAIAAVSQKAFGPVQASISAQQAGQTLSDALAALNNPNAGSGGGSSQTAAAAALDQAQKEIALRDAKQAVGDATVDLTRAEQTLTQAQHDQVTAAAALKTAQENVRTVLQGVAKDSQAAKDATDALTSAQNAAAGARIGVREARRNLEQVKNDRALAHFAVVDAQKQLRDDLKGGQGAHTEFVPTATGSKAVQVGGTAAAGPEQIAKDRIALKDAEIAESGAADQVKKAQLALSDAQIAAHKAAKDAAEAHRQYEGILHGFPPASKEAKDAQDQLTNAEKANRDATKQVADAQRGLREAIDATHDSAVNLFRAQADIAGKLNKISGAAKTLKQRLLDVENAALGMATSVGAADIAAGHSVAKSILDQIGILSAVAAANPLIAAAFGGAIKDLESKFHAALIKQFPQLPGLQAIFGTNQSLPGFAEGGVVPGPKGKAKLIVAHGGETIVPNSSLANSVPVRGGDTINLTVNTMDAHRDAPFIIRALEVHSAQNGGLPATIKTRN